MRLINVHTLELEAFFGSDAPPYSILSHLWGAGELTYNDWQTNPHASRHEPGFRKISFACTQSRADGLGYLWVDTACIDKRSSAELSEAINSMHLWYEQAAVCYAYLADVHSADGPEAFEASRWFRRGWTLQELLAPEDVRFF